MNREYKRMGSAMALAALTLAGIALADDFTIDRYTISGGGAVRTTGGAFELSGTIGQSDAATELAGGAFTLSGGFWFGQAHGDCNYDGGVNLYDFRAVELCMTDPEAELEPGCACLDFDDDGDVDLRDMAAYQVKFSG